MINTLHNLFAIETHIREGHPEGIPNPNSGADHSNDKTSPDMNIRENQNEDSSNGIIRDFLKKLSRI